MNDYKIEVVLKQQTPMIHFQHGEISATLRASEVKPKLDAFIKKKTNDGISESWLIKKDSEALNYKMRFKLNGDGETVVSKTIEAKCASLSGKKVKLRYNEKINEMYFANMVSGSNLESKMASVRKSFKETVFYTGTLTMTILCFDSKLLSTIKENIEEFFLTENFGTRQSKGFGGFVVSQIGKDTIKDYTFTYLKGKLGSRLYFYANTLSSDYHTNLNHAMTVYAVLKGGLNLTRWGYNRNTNQYGYRNPGRYIKGYIQRAYFDDIGKDTGSDKAFIKKNKPLPPNVTWPANRHPRCDGFETEIEAHNYDSYVFIRALLGLADKYEFRDLRKGTVNVYSLGENDFDIKRFKSPITIKIVGTYLFFIFNTKSISEITGKTFYLLGTDSRSNLKKLNGESICFNNRRIDKLTDLKTYACKKECIMANGLSINTPDTFGEDEVRKLISGFVDYFNSTRSKLVLSNRTNRNDVYTGSVSLELMKGANVNE